MQLKKRVRERRVLKKWWDLEEKGTESKTIDMIKGQGGRQNRYTDGVMNG